MHIDLTAKRIVIKIGTSIISPEGMGIEKRYIEGIVKELSLLQKAGKEILVVSSGAIGAGMVSLGLTVRPKNISLKQAAAAIGQSQLMKLYEDVFGKYNQTIAQVLLTHREFSNRKSYINIYDTLISLLNYKVIPIINENDTVGVEEIKVGDNDILSALVASLINADILIILTNTEGLYDQQKRLVSTVKKITPNILNMAKGTKSEFSTGGMQTKLEAAKIATRSGTTMIITHGKNEGVIRRVIEGERLGTTFLAQGNRFSSRKNWLYNLKISGEGEIEVDEGAKQALLHAGKSLLPSGILQTKGKFDQGSIILLVDRDGKKMAKGIANYSKKEIDQIKGKKSTEIEQILGYKYTDEVIHRDNLVLFPE